MNEDKQPSADRLRARLDMRAPILGFYDAPDPGMFEPLIQPKPRACVFSFYDLWIQGETLHLTKDDYGCGGAGRWMWGIELRSRKDFISFLVDDEGLKASSDLMEKWIDATPPYVAEHEHLFIGPLRENAWPYLKTATFLVNPDQLSALTTGAQYDSAPEDPAPVIAPFGSGCSHLLAFDDMTIAQASIGATDIAMRQYLPADIMTLTVTKPMFRRLCALDRRSFLFKPFLQRLRKARGFPEL